MFKNFLITYLRILYKQKVISFITIGGLTMAMAASLLIFYYVNYELSYDAFHDLAKHTYRASFDYYEEGKLIDQTSKTPYALGPKMLAELPEVINSCRVHPFYGNGVLTHQRPDGSEQQFFEGNLLYVDTSFFDIFSFALLAGDPHTALKHTKSLILTENMAEKYFGTAQNCIGKIIHLACMESK